MITSKLAWNRVVLCNFGVNQQGEILSKLERRGKQASVVSPSGRLTTRRMEEEHMR